MHTDWPTPSSAALAHSAELVALIESRIEAAGGWLDFASFMELALYAPGLGYYSAGPRKFGAAGDFVTAPEISPAFGACVARAVAPLLQPGDAILELGAGTAALAVTVLDELRALGGPAIEYQILEVSAELRERQAQRLRGRPVRWLDALPADFQGAILANEVADALPVQRFRRQADGVEVIGVERADDGLRWAARPAEPDCARQVAALESRVAGAWSPGYTSEYCPQLRPWVSSVADCLARGLLLVSDYGMSASEYYHPQRQDGTLICHYRHRAHTDPFLWPGLQDISAWVDFTAAAEAAVAAGLELLGYTTQAHFLTANGLLDETPPRDPIAQAKHAAGLRRLLLPGEMGEHFKVLALGRELTAGAIGIGRDLRHRL